MTAPSPAHERLRVRIAAVLIGVVILSGCAGPTTNDDAMRSQAARSANSATSEIETLKLAVTTQLDGNAWWRFTDVVVTDSETALDSINSTLASRQPPSTKTEAIRADTVTALGDAVDLAIDVRIAVRRHDESTLESLLPKLTQMSDRLGALEARAR